MPKRNAKAQNTEDISDERLVLLLLELAPYLAINPKTMNSRSLVDVENAKEEISKLLEILYQFFHESADIIATVKGSNRKFHNAEKPLQRLKLSIVSLLEKRFNVFDLRIECDAENFELLRRDYKRFKREVDSRRQEEHYALAVKACAQENTDLGYIHMFKKYFMNKSQQLFANQERRERLVRRQESHEYEKKKKSLLKDAIENGTKDKVSYPPEPFGGPYKPLEVISLHFFVSI